MNRYKILAGSKLTENGLMLIQEVEKPKRKYVLKWNEDTYEWEISDETIPEIMNAPKRLLDYEVMFSPLVDVWWDVDNKECIIQR